ncbi:VOC family protein [Aeromonas media]|uniref:VOC family protein n=1 Tax=Aeromonas media TaxID=651 RepID=UPI0038D07C6E
MTDEYRLHFEIPVQDLERAIRFYEALFEIALERVHIDDNEMALFPLLDGVLAKGESHVPSLDGTRVYLKVVDIALAMARALASGGVCLYPLTRVGERVRVAELRDPEGNRIGLQEQS